MSTQTWSASRYAANAAFVPALGQPVLIENVTGAGGSIGVGRVVAAAPDGYTVSIGHIGTHVANGAIYLQIALGTVLIFSVTRVIFVPFGDIAPLTALTVAALQLGKLPGTVWLVMLLAAAAVIMELGSALRERQLRRLPKVLVFCAVLPLLPVAVAAMLACGGLKLTQVGQMLLALALVLPVAPLLNRVVFQPLRLARRKRQHTPSEN